MKTNYLQLQKLLNATGKTYFSLIELKKFYPGSTQSLKVLLSHWVNTKLIYLLGRGFYAFHLAEVDYLHLAQSIDPNSYLSFEYALYFYNLIDQVPSVITLAAMGRQRIVTMSNWVFEYTHLKNELFWGYVLEKGIYIAEPEKALLDLIYLIARGKRSADLNSLETEKFNQKKIKEYLKKFPGYVKKHLYPAVKGNMR
jgi:predicted transcriptional regulator of viral defense system